MGREHCGGVEEVCLPLHPSSQGNIIAGHFLGQMWETGILLPIAHLLSCKYVEVVGCEQGLGVAGFLPMGHRDIDLCPEKFKARMTVAHNGRVRRGELPINLQFRT